MSKPIRMCISCRDRLTQDSLFRLQVRDSLLVPYGKSGRSFYLCKECIQKDTKYLSKVLRRVGAYLGGTELSKNIKEILVNG